MNSHRNKSLIATANKIVNTLHLLCDELSVAVYEDASPREYGDLRAMLIVLESASSSIRTAANDLATTTREAARRAGLGEPESASPPNRNTTTNTGEPELASLPECVTCGGTGSITAVRADEITGAAWYETVPCPDCQGGKP